MAKKKKSRYESSNNLSADSAMIAAANMLLDAGEIAYDSKDATSLIEAAGQFMNIAASLIGLEQLIDSTGREDISDTANSGAQVKRKIGFVL